MKKKLQSEKGQAIAELVVCLIPIFLLVTAGLFVASIGVENIYALRTARSNIDATDMDYDTYTGQNIYDWGEYGDDELMFTEDDVNDIADAASEDVTTITEQFQLQPFYDIEEETEYSVQMNIASGENLKPYVYNNFTQAFPNPDIGDIFPSENLFLKATALREGVGDKSGISTSEVVIDMKNALTKFFKIEVDLDLVNKTTNKVFIPSHYE